MTARAHKLETTRLPTKGAEQINEDPKLPETCKKLASIISVTVRGARA
jgi:hypothetical protein